MNPNSEQEELINTVEGVILVDAGAGTGKTFALTRRYSKLLEDKDLEPEDILLTTFTENAADNMKNRIMNSCSYKKSDLRNAPITTFHGYSNDLLRRKGYEAPGLIGIDDVLSSFEVIEGTSDFFEKKEFERFLTQFENDFPSYRKFLKVSDSSTVLSIIKKLCCKGVFPEKEGWYSGEELLEGRFEKFEKIFKQENKPKEGKRGLKNSELKNKLRDFDKFLFEEEAPEKSDVRGDKKVPEEFCREAFFSDRDDLFRFFHDVYFEYVKFAVENSFLNFQFMMMFAYLLLKEDESVRDYEGFQQIMIDEFQDTNELQLKLAVLLSDTGNITAVGDWKQSIFSFQNASVRNILDFTERMERFRKEVYPGEKNPDYSLDFKRISFRKNYRSGQTILDKSKEALLLKGSRKEKLDGEEVESKTVSLKAEKDFRSRIKCFRSSGEKEAVLSKIQEVVENPEYRYSSRNITYGDIAVLVRTKKFGLSLEKLAREHGLPVAFEGGVEVFNTVPGKILLAWTRIASNVDKDRGWALVLDHAGYSPGEVKKMVSEEFYPSNMERFKEEISGLSPEGFAQNVFDRYGFENGFTSRIVSVIEELGSSYFSELGDVSRFIKHCIDEGVEFEVDNSLGEEVFTIQTIHKAKGLEYPVVFIPDINRIHFPANNGSFRTIDFRPETGLRQRKKFDSGINCIVDNWKTKILYRSFPPDYDEERRLLYVAMTRAEKYLYLSAEKGKESRFFKGLDLPVEEVEDKPSVEEYERKGEKQLVFEKSGKRRPVKISAHRFVNLKKGSMSGRGPEFGQKVHSFAEDIVNGRKPEEAGKDFKNVEKFLSQLEGDIYSEKTVLLPLSVEGRKYSVEGVVDLVVVRDGEVDIIDLKTDTSDSMESEYVKQLSVYFHALKEIFSSKNVRSFIYYTFDGRLKQIEPLKIDELEELLVS